MPRFFGYIRVSDVAGRGGDSFISPAVQGEAIERLAVAKGLTLGEVIEELDVSGGKAVAERKLGAIIEAIEAGEAEGVITWKLSRFSRSLADGVAAAKRITDAGGRLVAEDADSAEPNYPMLLGLWTGLAEQERARISEGWEQSRSRAIARGVFPGKPAYGYDKGKDKVLVRNPEQAPVVQQIFSLRADGLGLAAIARELEAQGIRSPKGGPRWSHSTLRQILGMRVYLGEVRHGSHENLTAHEPLLSPAEFAAAQHATTRQVGDPRAHSKNALVKGLAYCAGCGHTLKVLPPNWKGVPHYYCKGPYAAGACPARCHVTDIATLDRYVEAWFLAAIRDVAPVAQAEEASERASEALRALEAAQAELDAFLEHASALANADYATAYEKKKSARDLAQLVYAETTQEVKKFEAYPSGALLDRWPTLSVDQRRQLIGSVVDRVNVSKAPPTVPIADRVQFVRGGVVLEVPEEVRVELAAQHP